MPLRRYLSQILFLSLCFVFSAMLQGSQVFAAPDVVHEDISADDYFTCRAMPNQRFHCWPSGSGYSIVPPPPGFASQVSVAEDHSCGLQGFFPICWGDDIVGQSTPPNTTMSSIAAGYLFSCGVKPDQTIVCWGDNTYGQSTPPSGTFSQVVAGSVHACGLRTDNSIACWGWNEDGQATPPSGNFTHLSAFDNHNCAIRTDGSLACWGENNSGELTSPAGSFSHVDIGDFHACGILSGTGALSCWGYSGYGLTTPPAGAYTHVTSGSFYSCAIKSNTEKTTVCWGNHLQNEIYPYALDEGTLNRVYSVNLSTYNGTAPITYSLLSGSLPPGLSLSSSGSLSGLPTSAGSFTFTVRSLDTNLIAVEKAYELFVRVGTSTALTSAPNPSLYGQTLVLTATISPAYSGYGTPTGSVLFRDGATVLGGDTLDEDGVANLFNTSLVVGSHTLKATYYGDTTFHLSTSPTITQVITKTSTTTTLLVSPSSLSVYGQSVAITAQVRPVAPGGNRSTGSVFFYSDAALIGSVTLDASGNGTLNYSSLSVATHSLTASYAGDANFYGNTSTATSYKVDKASTTTYLYVSPSPSVIGQAVVMTATVSVAYPGGGIPAGTVTFRDGTNTLGSASLNSSGVATFSTSNLSFGAHSLNAQYAGSPSYNPSGSSNASHTVNAASTTTSLTSSPNPSLRWASVTLTATVSAVAPGGGIPSGSVTFKDGTTSLGSATLNASGKATLSTTALPSGDRSLTADYTSSTTSYLGSSSLVYVHMVNKMGTSTNLTSSPQPSAYQQLVTLTAYVTPTGSPPIQLTGSVNFKEGETLLGTGTLSSGSASLTISSLSVGSHSLTAEYVGDANFSSSTSAIRSHTVNKATTTTGLSGSPNPAVYGQTVNLTATVTSAYGGTATGIVDFYEGATLLGSATLNGSGQAVLGISSLSVNTHFLTASYLGDSQFNSSSSGQYPQVINKANTTTALAANPNPSVFGQTVTLTATVSAVSPGAGIPGGSVSFKDGANVIGSATLNANGKAILAIGSLTVGNHNLTAVYSGNTSFNPSPSPTVVQVVNQANTATTLAAAPTPSVFGQQVTLSATVSPVSPGGGIPSGQVTFYEGMSNLGIGALNGSGVATLILSGLTVGSHTYHADYGGDASFKSSSSSNASHTVNPASTNTVLNSSPRPSTYGQSVTLQATVSVVSPGGGIPAGNVTFKDGASNLGSAALNASGQASLVTSSLAAATHTLSAVYEGSTNHQGSGSANLYHAVNKASTLTSLVTSPNPSVFGQTVTLTATVTVQAPGGGVPAGVVVFYAKGISLGEGSLNEAGKATLLVSSLSVDSYAMTAAYTGESNYLGSSTAAPVTQVVNKADTATSLLVSPPPSVYGQAVVLTATVITSPPGAGIPSGNVLFKDASTTLTSQPLNANGQATYQISSLGVATHNLTAQYSESTNFKISVSAVVTHTVGKASTSTTLTTSPNPSDFNQLVTLSAHVAASFPGTGMPTGMVTFRDGEVVLSAGTLSSGNATFNISNLSQGYHDLTATYSGDGSFNGSTSTNHTHLVRYNTTTTLVALPNPSVWGESVILTTTVSATGTVPTGTVTIMDGATKLGEVVLDFQGKAALSVASLSIGSHSVRAEYGGSVLFKASQSQPVMQIVQPGSVQVGLIISPPSSVFGETILLTTTVVALTPASGTPSGSVTFKDGEAILGSAALDTLSQASLSISTLAVATHSLMVVYAGDVHFLSGSSAVTEHVVEAADTTTSLVSYPNSSVYGEQVTLTTTVTASAPGTGIPTGSASFYDGEIWLGEALLDGQGQAVFLLSSLTVGEHTLSSTYDGSINHKSSTSAGLSHTIVLPGQQIRLFASRAYIALGQAVDFTVTVTSTLDVIATGQVDLKEGENVLLSGSLDGNGKAFFKLVDLPLGEHELFAYYFGDACYSPGSSNSVLVTVDYGFYIPLIFR